MFLVLFLSTLIISILLYLDSRKPANFPPGPKWLPILGSIIEIKKMREKCGILVRTLKILADYHQTNVLGIRIGTDRVVITSDVESTKQMLLNEDIDGRPKGIFYRARTWGERKGIVLTDGDLWKVQRKFILRHLKEFGLGKRAMTDISQTEAEYLLKEVEQICKEDGTDSALIEINELFGVYVLNTLWTMMAGIRYSREDPQMKVLGSLLFELFRNIDMVGALFGHFPLLRFVAPDMSGYNRYIEIHEKICNFLNAELDNHIKRFKVENEDRDFMDTFIRVMKCSNRAPHFSERQLLAVCMDMFMAGQETTNKSMGFAFLYLVREQEVQKKARSEIDAVIGRDRLPCIDDRPNLPYNEAVCMESIRHFLGNSFGIPHRAVRNTKLCGYEVPMDTTVIANYNGILMNDKYFEDAKAFKPERFIINGKINVPDSYVPFGTGKHRCIGESLAKCNIFLFMTTLLQNFEIKPAPGEPLPSTEPIDGATPSAQSVRALVSLRQK